jgi:uncharacterized coiled-coil protein SlyX
MALPKQVQAQLAEVEELEKALTARESKSEETEKQADTETDGTDPKTKEVAKSGEAKPADTSSTDVADDFEQKYRTLQGKYDAEVPRLHQQVRELSDKLGALQKQLAEKKPAEPTKPKEKVSLVTDADRAEFGEELIDVQRRVAQEVAQDYEDRLEAQARVIEELRSQVVSTGSRVGEMSFSQQLNALVPDFAQVDRDERWVAWLNEYDPMLRAPRRVQAKAAFDAGDAEAVAHYVQLWKQSITEPTGQGKDPRQSELEKQVAPNRSASSASVKSTGRDAKIYSEREVNGVWNKIRTLNTRGQYDEAAKLEAEITAAYLEGRVR